MMRGISCRRPRRPSTSLRRIRFTRGCAAPPRSTRSNICSWLETHLNPGGIVTQWIPLYETDLRSVKSEIATFAQVFPDTTLWNPDLLEEGYDLVALGRVAAHPISEAAIDARIGMAPRVQASLDAVKLPIRGSGPRHLCGPRPRPGAATGRRGDQP